MEDKKALIRALNDGLRTTFLGGRVLVTAGVQSLPEELRSRALSAVREYRDFTGDNDPHGEHDFGSFELAGHTFFWKIDYYDKDESHGAEDPADPSSTIRVLTIMLAEDY
jgi:hypothetical protein